MKTTTKNNLIGATVVAATIGVPAIIAGASPFAVVAFLGFMWWMSK